MNNIKTISDAYDVFVARLLNQAEHLQINSFIEELKEAKTFKDRKNYCLLRKKIEGVSQKANIIVSDELIKELDDDIQNCGLYY